MEIKERPLLGTNCACSGPQKEMERVRRGGALGEGLGSPDRWAANYETAH